MRYAESVTLAPGNKSPVGRQANGVMTLVGRPGSKPRHIATFLRIPNSDPPPFGAERIGHGDRAITAPVQGGIPTESYAIELIFLDELSVAGVVDTQSALLVQGPLARVPVESVVHRHR